LANNTNTSSCIDYPCRPAGRFQNISSLTIYVADNYDDTGDSGTEITYVGFKGRGTALRRGVVDAVYEARVRPMCACAFEDMPVVLWV